MTSDRELLELAAKAIGLKFHAYVDSEFFGRGINTGELETPLWNPLENDGDALRLAVRLEMFYSTSNETVTSFIKAQFADDPTAATRRAIVIAAAHAAHDQKEGKA